MPAPKSGRTDPWGAMDALVAQTVEPMGPEWFTADQFSKRYNHCISYTNTTLRSMVAKGQLECWSGKIAAIKRRGNKYKVKTP